MSYALTLHLILAFAVGSLWVTFTTMIAEKKGSVLGGILGGLPSTSAFSFFFIAINQSPQTAVEATTVFPLVFAITSAYLFFYAYFAKKGFRIGMTVSLILWFLISASIVFLGIKDFWVCLAGGILISTLTFLGFTRVLKLDNIEGKGKLYRPQDVAFRGVGAGTLVLLSVVLSQVSGPIIGGVAAAFPAVFTSTLVILNHTRGTEFSRSTAKPLVYSGIFTIIPYTVMVRFFYPVLGVWFGTLLSYGLVLPLAYLSYQIAQK